MEVKELDPVEERSNFYVHQESKFEFLEIELQDNGKRLIS
jgi:hypothetical protein